LPEGDPRYLKDGRFFCGGVAMSKYQIERKCGHIEEMQIYGAIKDRDRRAEWESGKLCYECYKAEQARKRAEESAAASTAAQADGLPALAGSEKQIAWAESIRRALVDGVEKILAGYEAKEPEKVAMFRADFRNVELAETSSHVWIENRDRLPCEVARTVAVRVVAKNPELTAKKETTR
jgi:hypothetical protein